MVLCIFSDARSMAKDVHNIILKVVQEKGNMSEQEAIAYVKKMEAQKRYSTDVWSWAGSCWGLCWSQSRIILARTANLMSMIDWDQFVKVSLLYGFKILFF